MLGESMRAELLYFLAAVLYGGLVTAGYYPLMFLRTLIKHTRAFVDAEDILYFSAAGFAFFLVAYHQNNGILRWYAFAGAGLGIWLFQKSAGVLLENVRMWLLQKIGKPFTIRIKAGIGEKGNGSGKFIRKGKVSVDESSSPKHKSKKKKRVEGHSPGGSGAVRSHYIQRHTAEGGTAGTGNEEE